MLLSEFTKAEISKQHIVLEFPVRVEDEDESSFATLEPTSPTPIQSACHLGRWHTEVETLGLPGGTGIVSPCMGR